MTADILKLVIPPEAEPPTGVPRILKGKIPSALQENIFAAVRESQDHLLIQAVAGSSKTTVLMASTMWTRSPTLYLAFNKANALDAAGKLEAGEAKTLNALGHRLWMINAPQAKLDAKKTEKILEWVLPSEELRRKFGYILGRVISSAKAAGLGLESEVNGSDFEHFILNGEWDIDDQDILPAAEYAARAFEAGRNDLTTFDFDDQLYGPIYHGWQFPFFATVLLDEAQDLNRIQHLMAEQLVRMGARLIAVGDRNQAIYGFRGALHDSLDLLKAYFKMKELPLSITYRCPQLVVKEAQALVPHIQHRDGAPFGEVRYQHETEDSDPECWLRDNDLIVCRNNAPLFAAVMRQVRARKPCRVLSNALDGLASFIKRFRTQDAQALLIRVDRWLEKETLAAESKGMPWKVQALADKAATVRSLAEGFKTTEEVLNVIRQLAEGRSGPLFSTIHKAKGLEADHVYFLRPDLVPGWWIKEESALQQEYNLKYVAITRAKQTLTYGLKK